MADWFAVIIAYVYPIILIYVRTSFVILFKIRSIFF